MDLKCLRCRTGLCNEYQLIFDETGIELQLDKLLAEHFEISIEKDLNTTQALCEECVNKLIELYDLTEKNQQLESAETEPQYAEEIEFTFKEEEELIIEEEDPEPEPEPEPNADSEHDEIETIEKLSSYNDNEEFFGFDNSNEENLAFTNVQYLDELEGFSTHEYVREVIKSELQEITFEQSTTCRLCEELLKSHTAVLMHTSINHETELKKYPCIICNKVEHFNSIKELAYHIVLKHYDLDIITIYCMCPECGKRFSTFVEYNKHSCYKAKVGSRLLQECMACLKEFTSNKRYRFHLQFHLEKRRPKACFICDILFRDENNFFEHIMYAHEKHNSLICKKCDRVCTSKQLYDTHIKLHNAVRSYHCPYCTKSYLYKQMLTNHIQRHHTQKDSNMCKICKKSLASKHLLTRHMQLKHLEETEENINECSVCGLVGSSEENIQDHIGCNLCPNAKLISECLKIAYACEFCELAYNSVKNLKAHRMFHDRNRYTCWICESQYSEFKKLKTHIITHNKYDPIQKTFPINRHYVCDYDSCDQSYLTWPSLHAHKVRHAADAKFTCEVCNQAFRTQSQINTHLKAHENNEEYPCQFCSKMFCSQMSLAVHISRKHNNNCKSCPTCNSTYNSEEALQEHIDTNHVELKCEHCGKVTKNKRNLEIHVRMVHTKVKRFFCSTCNKGYYNNADLKVHERASHAESHKFKCPHCSFSSSYEVSFNAHILKHEATKPFKCNECSREFTRKMCFKLHMLRHSDVKPFVCPLGDCGRSFVTRGILNSHIRDNHQDSEKKVSRVAPRPTKRKRSSIQRAQQVTTPPNSVKYVIMDVDPENNSFGIGDEEDGLVIFDASNTEQEVVLDCVEDGNDLIVDLNQSEVVDEYTVDPF